MARRRGFVRGAVAISQARKTAWGSFPDVDATMATPGIAILVATFNAATLAVRPFTIVRTHLTIGLFSDQAAAIERQRAAIGLAVVSDQASGVGITAVPTPVTDAASDLWMLHRWAFADESEVTDRTRGATFLQIDSKAMRKVNADEDVVLVAESALNIGAGAVMAIAGRFLIKFH